MASEKADGPLRSVMRNAGYLGSTKVIGALFAIAALSFAGRGLGLRQFGVMMLIHTFALGANAICSFQSWQMIVRYGAPALARNDKATATDAVRFSLGLDLASGLVGMIGAMLLLPVLAARFGIDTKTLPLAVAYCTVIPGMASATPTGVMRLFGRFDLMAMQQPVTSVVRACATFAAWRLHAGLPIFLLAWYSGNIAGDGVNWILCRRELIRNEMPDAMRPALQGPASRLSGVWRFAWTTNLSTTISSGWGSVGNLLVGAMLGPSAAGIYKVASSLLDAAGRPADMMSRSFYPEIMKQDPVTPAPWTLSLRLGAIAGGFGLVTSLFVLLGGRSLVLAAFGPRYADADALLSIMTIALTVSMATFPLQSLLYMAGRATTSLVAEVLGTVAYLTFLVTLSGRYGLPGAAWAYVVGTVTASLAMLLPVLSARRDMTARRIRPWTVVEDHPTMGPDDTENAESGKAGGADPASTVTA